MHFGLHNSHAHFGDSRARLYPASGPGKGRIYQSMVCIIVVPDSDCCIYIYRVSVQWYLFCSNLESNGMHHSCSRYILSACPMVSILFQSNLIRRLEILLWYVHGVMRARVYIEILLWVCSWSYESKGIHHGCSRLRMIQMTYQSKCVPGPVNWKRIPREIFWTKSFRKMK